MSKKQIIIMNEGIDFDVKDASDCVEAIIEEYHAHDVSMYDILACVEVRGFSAQDVAYIYAECMKRSDGDVIVHIREDIDDDFLKNHEVLGVD